MSDGANNILGEGISGRFPHFVIAKTEKGYWACYRLDARGFHRLSLSYYSPADAARTMHEYLLANPEIEKSEVES